MRSRKRRTWFGAAGAWPTATGPSCWPSFVETPSWAPATAEEKRALEQNLRFAEDLGAEIIRVQAADVAKALMQVAHEKNVGSIVIGHSRHGRLHELLRGSIVQNLLRLAGDVDVHVVADRNCRTS